MQPNVRLVIVTGLSGAGKTEALKSLEDVGYFCVDNLPPAFIPKMAELCVQSEGKISRLALGIDIRGGEFFSQTLSALDELERAGYPYTILFLEASDAVLVRRYKESRHRHPLAAEGRIEEAIRRERRLLEELRGRAGYIVDTSNMTVNQLRQEIVKLLGQDSQNGRPGLLVHVVSFGFKHGLPMDADLVFDVRFLPNPHYVQSLRDRTGEDPAVEEYVNRWAVTRKFLRRLQGLLGFLLPQYEAEGKTQLTIAVGCTGGQHRSVVVARQLAQWLGERGYRVTVEHRDARAVRAEERE
ncbi:RNase adapter RapZ [Caldinitratiruptor microaerophilus]|uniref:RNase adaptor protein RapZ n=1 Tax=Caldinitratiruptor microaerophilus TaxID=671077 RepID=A0AA35GAU1_9FIRM|nr:RNase adapter RapZ [Caldinitratiruptor microaerophilus]BDG61669.1 RNase adaptor protein RapZ [Caldinitratiruptor microaerophilus]